MTQESPISPYYLVTSIDLTSRDAEVETTVEAKRHGHCAAAGVTHFTTGSPKLLSLRVLGVLRLDGSGLVAFSCQKQGGTPVSVAQLVERTSN